jgi:Tfp pilus assembly protein PilF
VSISRPAFAVAVLVLALVSLSGCRGDSEDKLLESAQSFMAKKEYKSATIQLKTLLQRNANSPGARYMLGKALLETGDPAGALLELRKARDLSHPDDQVLPDMARAMLLTGEHARVVSQFGTTVLGTPAAQADLYTSVAIAHAASAQIDRAKESLGRALRANPQFAPALILQARMKAGENDLEGATRWAPSLR